MLKQRIVTAVVLILLLLVAILLLPRPLTVTVLTLLTLVGAWEWAGFLDLRRWFGRAGFVLLVAGFMAGAWWIATRTASLDDLLWLTLTWWIVAGIMIVSYPFRLPTVAAALCGVLVLVPAWLALARLDLIPQRGPELLLFMLSLVWAADIGAYFVGRSCGRLRLALSVSPNKTWEGVAGGFAAAALLASAGGLWFGLPLGAFVPLGLAVAGLSIIGDLTVSLFKRRSGLKDSGHLFPGHGGLLDRMDSITAAAPLFLLGLHWLGVST